jgi:hypothetical protein
MLPTRKPEPVRGAVRRLLYSPRHLVRVRRFRCWRVTGAGLDIGLARKRGVARADHGKAVRGSQE